MSGNVMPKEQYDFIKGIQDYMLEASNMKEDEAWSFGFRIWQFQDWLKGYMEKHQLSPETSTNEGETSTISEKESVEGDLFNKSFWRMGLHDSNVRPRTMEETSTNKVDTSTDLISRAEVLGYINRVKNSGLGKNKSLEYIGKYVKRTETPYPRLIFGEKVEFATMCCEDAISRADTIKAMCSECEVFPGDDMNCADCTEVAIVRSMPPVTPTERPKGEWVRHELWNMPWYTCSECNFHGRNDYKFCPNCGADMRGDKE